MAITTEADFKAYVESLTSSPGREGGTCQRPDISSYDVCDDCPFTTYCLCHLNTSMNMAKRRRKLKRI